MAKIRIMSSMSKNQYMNDIIYILPNSEHQLIFASKVLQTFSAYRQRKNDSEAGGLLFAEFDLPIIRIIEASTPNKRDKRWKTLFIPYRFLQRRLIIQRFKEGYHFIGEWHTHPIVEPTPSLLDLKSTTDAFLKSRHELNYFVMAIVGNTLKKLKLWVSIHDGLHCYHIETL